MVIRWKGICAWLYGGRFSRVVEDSGGDGSEQIPVAALKSANQEAWNSMWSALQPPACGMAFRVLRDEGESENVASEAFHAVFLEPSGELEVGRLKRIGRMDQLTNYIKGIARKKAIDVVRMKTAKKRFGGKLAFLDLADIEPLIDPSEHTAPVVGRSDVSSESKWLRLEDHLAKGDIETLKARFEEDLSLDEIAERMGRTKKYLSVRMFRAFGKIRELIKTDPEIAEMFGL